MRNFFSIKMLRSSQQWVTVVLFYFSWGLCPHLLYLLTSPSVLLGFGWTSEARDYENF